MTVRAMTGSDPGHGGSGQGFEVPSDRRPYRRLPMQDGSWTIDPCDYADVRALADALDLGEITASILVRRGYRDVEQARAFVAGEIEPHDPFLLGDMAVAVERIRAAIADGERICVHGDYDVDGICATALAVLTLRTLGADVEWHLPSRFEEGYGVSDVTISRLADEGCSLLLTVDCGITAVEEVAAAKARGLDVIVTDHHRPGATLAGLPDRRDAPVGLSVPGALRHRCRLQARAGARRRVAPYLDLVALATIADVVPLLDENRSLAIAGLRALARTQRPGPSGADAEREGRPRRRRRCGRRFPARAADQCRRPARAPRRRARAAADDRRRGGKAARRRARAPEPGPAGGREQDPASGDRRGRVVAGAEAASARLRDLGRGLARGRDRDRCVAPRRALQPPGRPDRGDRRSSGRAPGRSLPAFDLHGALSACSEHLHRFGGHKAAAGLAIEPAKLDAFFEAFAAHADAHLVETDLAPVTRVDAIVPGSALTLGLRPRSSGSRRSGSAIPM